MKKLIFVIGICALISVMPAISAFSYSDIKNVETNLTIDAPPEWATGNFTGEWGISVFGVPFVPLGWLKGYYSQNWIITRFEGTFAEFNETNATGKISGIIFGPFMFGGIEEIATGNNTVFVGLGGVNETQYFYWRIMVIAGPNFYMYGNYTKFE